MFRKILVVGGKGFIGSHLPDKWKVCDIKENCDFRTVNCDKADVVVFLAADLKNTQKAYKYNESLYKALDKYLKQYPDTHVVYTSSAAVYDDVIYSHSEGEPLTPSTFYGGAKLLGEHYVKQYKNYTILRLSNVYGRGGHGVIDIFKRGGTTIYGSGEQVRDFIPVEEVAKVIETIVRKPKKFNKKIYNISSGKGMTINQIWKVFGKGVAIHRRARTGDIQYSVLRPNRWRRHG